MTLKQAQYHAKRAAVAEFTKHMSNKNNIRSRAWQRFDSAEYSARLAYDATLRGHGFNPISDRVDFRFSNAGQFILEGAK